MGGYLRLAEYLIPLQLRKCDKTDRQACVAQLLISIQNRVETEVEVQT